MVAAERILMKIQNSCEEMSNGVSQTHPVAWNPTHDNGSKGWCGIIFMTYWLKYLFQLYTERILIQFAMKDIHTKLLNKKKLIWDITFMPVYLLQSQ